jgi:hypothetical protein
MATGDISNARRPAFWTQTCGDTRTIIGSQVHAYAANTPKRPWHSVPNWPDHVTGDDIRGRRSVFFIIH